MTPLQRLLANPFIRNLGWLGAGQLVIRVSRLVTTVILARMLSPYDYGLAAIVLTTSQFVRVFTQTGLDTQLIQAEAAQIEELAISAYWLNWVIYSCLFVIQCLAAFPIAWFYHHENRLIVPICTLALVYLMDPIGGVQSALIVRENRLKITALADTLQVTVDNMITAVFALLGMGMWAIVLPKLLVAPIWIGMNYLNHPWRPHGRFTAKHWGTLMRFGRSVLGVELLKTLRDNIDYLLVGKLLGVQELGIYYFAFNAGLGISLSFINAINTALFPHLCAARAVWSDFRGRYLDSLKIISVVIIPLVILQSSLAHWYVPIIFGHKWVAAIPVLVLICLSAIPRPYGDAASQLLLAIGQPVLNLRWSLVFTVLFAMALILGAHWGIVGVATAVFIAHGLFLGIFAVWTTRYVFPRRNH